MFAYNFTDKTVSKDNAIVDYDNCVISETPEYYIIHGHAGIVRHLQEQRAELFDKPVIINPKSVADFESAEILSDIENIDTFYPDEHFCFEPLSECLDESTYLYSLALPLTKKIRESLNIKCTQSTISLPQMLTNFKEIKNMHNTDISRIILCENIQEDFPDMRIIFECTKFDNIVQKNVRVDSAGHFWLYINSDTQYKFAKNVSLKEYENTVEYNKESLYEDIKYNSEDEIVYGFNPKMKEIILSEDFYNAGMASYIKRILNVDITIGMTNA